MCAALQSRRCSAVESRAKRRHPAHSRDLLIECTQDFLIILKQTSSEVQSQYLVCSTFLNFLTTQ